MALTNNTVWVEYHEGTLAGRQATLDWLVPVMKQCEGWTYPIQWHAIDGNRVIHKWLNRLPGQRPDGSDHEFAGLTVMEYAGDGEFSFQEDIYNWEEVVPVLREWAGAR
jgi:hypothetical protein